MEDNSTLPALQDLLEDFDDARLEELAETLLADVITNMENDIARGEQSFAEGEGTAKQLFESMVGSTTEQLESSRHAREPTSCSDSVMETHNYSKLYCDAPKTNTDAKSIESISPAQPQNGKNKMRIKKEKIEQQNITNDNLTDDNNTLYGTYDNSSHCITVLVSDDSIPIDNTVVIEEIYCDEEVDSTDEKDVSSTSSSSSITCDIKFEPPMELLSPIPGLLASDDADSTNDCLENNLNLITCDIGGDKSPFTSITSDCGYESLGSPNSDMMNFTDFWNDTFSELFPALV